MKNDEKAIWYRDDDNRTPIDPEWTAALIRRSRQGAPLRQLGAEFGCSHMTVSNIVAKWSDWYDRRYARRRAAPTPAEHQEVA